MAQQITYDKAYDTVAPEDFPAMLEVPRYGRRSDAFDSIISATHDHFWDPLDKNYIDFDQPFDMATTLGGARSTWWSSCAAPSPTGWTTARRSSSPTTSCTGRSPTCCMASRARCRCRPACATSCSIPAPRNTPPTRRARRRATSPASPATSPSAGAQPLPVGKTIATVLADLVSTPEVYKKIVGMQMLVEGLAMGAFATLNAQDQRSGAAPPGAAGDERRGLPPPLRQDLGGQDHPPSQRGGAPQGRGLGGPDLPDPAVQPDQHRAEAGRSTPSTASTGSGCATR